MVHNFMSPIKANKEPDSSDCDNKDEFQPLSTGKVFLINENVTIKKKKNLNL